MLVDVRNAAADDAAWLDTWLAAVAASVGYEVDAEAPGAALLARVRRERSLRASVIERAGERAGIIVWRANAPRRACATFELVATPPLLARHGMGMRAAALIEHDMREAGVRVVNAPAPAMHGIAVYFWIRLGYRPLLRPDWPCERAGVAWLRRDL